MKYIPWVDRFFGVFDNFLSDNVVLFRYIVVLFVLSLSFLVIKSIIRWTIFYASTSLSSGFNVGLPFWSKLRTEEEKRYFNHLKQLFEKQKKQSLKSNQFTPVGFVLIRHIMSGINQGLTDGQIIRLLPSTLSLMDVLPLIEAMRGFRDLAARKILDFGTHKMVKSDYANAMRDLLNGEPKRAVQLMQKELRSQQQILFSLRDNVLQQYAKKEASKLALHVGLILGFYDVNLAQKAFKRAMELDPKENKNLILFSRFRTRHFGTNDKVASLAFLKLAKGVDKTLQAYMLNYAAENVRRSEIRLRQDEIKSRIWDEKERYSEAVNVERLKVREVLRMAQIRSIADEANSRG